MSLDTYDQLILAGLQQNPPICLPPDIMIGISRFAAAVKNAIHKCVFEVTFIGTVTEYDFVFGGEELIENLNQLQKLTIIGNICETFNDLNLCIPCIAINGTITGSFNQIILNSTAANEVKRGLTEWNVGSSLIINGGDITESFNNSKLDICDIDISATNTNMSFNNNFINSDSIKVNVPTVDSSFRLVEINVDSLTFISSTHIDSSLLSIIIKGKHDDLAEKLDFNLFVDINAFAIFKICSKQIHISLNGSPNYISVFLGIIEGDCLDVDMTSTGQIFSVIKVDLNKIIVNGTSTSLFNQTNIIAKDVIINGSHGDIFLFCSMDVDRLTISVESQSILVFAIIKADHINIDANSNTDIFSNSIINVNHCTITILPSVSVNLTVSVINVDILRLNGSLEQVIISDITINAQKILLDGNINSLFTESTIKADLICVNGNAINSFTNFGNNGATICANKILISGNSTNSFANTLVDACTFFVKGTFTISITFRDLPIQSHFNVKELSFGGYITSIPIVFTCVKWLNLNIPRQQITVTYRGASLIFDNVTFLVDSIRTSTVRNVIVNENTISLLRNPKLKNVKVIELAGLADPDNIPYNLLPCLAKVIIFESQPNLTDCCDKQCRPSLCWNDSKYDKQDESKCKDEYGKQKCKDKPKYKDESKCKEDCDESQDESHQSKKKNKYKSKKKCEN